MGKKGIFFDPMGIAIGGVGDGNWDGKYLAIFPDCSSKWRGCFLFFFNYYWGDYYFSSV